MADIDAEATAKLVPDSSLPFSKPSAVSSSRLPARPHVSHWHRYTDSWAPELAALALSSASLIATAGILGYYNGKPVPELGAGLTLNAIISILATTSKASLIFSVSNSIGQLKWVWFNGPDKRKLLDAEVFNNASRGPLGALQMLFTSTRRSIASLGAIIVILTLAFDPFVQQATRYQWDVRNHPTDLSSSQLAIMESARVINNPYGGFEWSSMLNSIFWRDDFDWDLTGCSTGNCTWSNFETLAWHSKCYNDKNWTLSSDCNLTFTTEEAEYMKSPGSVLTRSCEVSRSGMYPLETSGLAPMELRLENYGFPNNPSSVWLSISSSILTTKVYGLMDSPPSYDIQEDANNPMLILGYFNLSEHRGSVSLQVTTCEIDLYIDRYELRSIQGRLERKIVESLPLQKMLLPLNGSSTSDKLVTCLTPSPNSTNSEFFRSFITPQMYNDSGVLLENLSYCPPPENVTSLNFWPLFISYEMKCTATALLSMGDNMSFLSRMYDTSNHTTAEAWISKGSERIMSNLAASLSRSILNPKININGTKPVYGEVGISIAVVRVN